MKRVSATGTPSIDCLSVLVQTRSITTYMFIYRLARSRSRSASLSSLDHGFQVYFQIRSITASKCISKLARLRSPNSLDYGLQVYIQTRSITASKCISMLGRLWSPNSLDHGLQVYLQICSITASKCISKLARSQPWSVSLSSLDPHFQALLELLSSTACSQSRYTVCRWVAI